MTLQELLAMQSADPFGGSTAVGGPPASSSDTLGPALAQGWAGIRHMFPPTGNNTTQPAMPPTNGAAPTMPGQAPGQAPPAPATPMQTAMAAPAPQTSAPAPAAPTTPPIGAPMNLAPANPGPSTPAPANGYGSVTPTYTAPQGGGGQLGQQNPGLINQFVNTLRGAPNPQAAPNSGGIMGGLQSTIGNIGNYFGLGSAAAPAFGSTIGASGLGAAGGGSLAAIF